MSDREELIERLDGLAGRVTRGPWRALSGSRGTQIHADAGAHAHWIANMKCESCPSHEQTNAALIVELVNNLPAILSALRSYEPMKEALEYVSGCYDAAQVEGLYERILEIEFEPGNLRGLIERRLYPAFDRARTTLETLKKDEG